MTRVDLRKLNAPINASMARHVAFNRGAVVRRQTWRRWLNAVDDLEEYATQRDTIFLEKSSILYNARVKWSQS